MLTRLCALLAETHPAMHERHFAPHDFRRLFATDVVNHGLPIHIAPRFSVTSTSRPPTATSPFSTKTSSGTTRGTSPIAAPCDPSANTSRSPDTERTEFEAHFDKRKVELGQCGRPYATPCTHDTPACARLQELETDLLARRERALTKGWHGGLEGLDLTLQFLHDKRADIQRIARSPIPTALGMPMIGGPT